MWLMASRTRTMYGPDRVGMFRVRNRFYNAGCGRGQDCPITVVGSCKTTEDTVNSKPYPDSPFDSWEWKVEGCTASGRNSVGSYENKPLLSVLLQRPTVSAPFGSASDTNRVLAQSGPLTPRVHLPLFVYEMKDIPMMLRHAGNLLHGLRRPSGLSPDKEAAAATLAYQFGWAPLMQDLGRMLDFADQTRKRQRQLEKAHSEKGLRRKITLGEETTRQTRTEVLHSSEAFWVESNVHITKTHKDWATVRWIVRDQGQIGRKPTFNEAFRSAYGLNRGHIPIQVWKALPWSWAIDWFGDISNILTANYNSIYYKPKGLNFMRTITVTEEYEPSINFNGGGHPQTFTGGVRTCVRKQRKQAPASTSFRIKLPFLDNFKLSILGSMTILRIRGR